MHVCSAVINIHKSLHKINANISGSNLINQLCKKKDGESNQNVSDCAYIYIMYYFYRRNVY